MGESDRRAPPGPPSFPSQAERRQITVLFCDLVGSTELSSRLDPEDLRDVLQQFQAACGKAVAFHGGFIARYMGDGILVYFGYPVGHEDAPCRAVRAGLEIVRAVHALRSPTGSALGVRVAAATGLGVIGDQIGSGVAAEIGVTGKVANLAARILAIAEPNAVLVAAETRRLARVPFEFEDLGLRQMKGIDSEVRVWKVLGERVDYTRYEAQSDGAGFVGRAEELGTLHTLWAEASLGYGRIAIVRGEAGIGKTALLRRFESELQGQPFTRILLQCSSHHIDSPLYPLIMHLRRAASIEPTDSPAAKMQKIESMMPKESAARGVPLLASLLSVPSGGKYPPLSISPATQKAQTLQLVVDYTSMLAAQQPVLLLVEDAHWIDHTSAELAALLAKSLRSTRVLVVIAARPEYWPAWGDTAHVSLLALPPLAEAHVRQLVQLAAQGNGLTPPLVDRIVERAEGIPLFAEELTKTVSESLRSGADVQTLQERIPETLQDSLLARLDRLGPDKQLAQMAAVLGRKFTVSMLDAFDHKSTHGVTANLGRLVASGLLVVRGEDVHREYTFSHALMQETAYESLLRSQRRQLHLRFAQTLVDHFQDMVETEPEILAHHWTCGDRAEAAVPCWLRAAQRSVARAANVEAIRHVGEGIALLPQLAASRERDALDFNLHLILGQAAYVVDGPAAASTGAAYTRAQAMLEIVGDGEQRYTVLYGIFSSYHFASRFELAREPAVRALELATRERDKGHLCQAHRMLGYIAFFTGDTVAARTHFQALAALYSPEEHGRLAARYGADCRVGARGFHCLVECLRGDLDGAIEMCLSNLAYAQSLGHPASTGWAYASAGYLYYYLRDPAAASAITADGIRYCSANNVGSWLAHCKAFNLWAESCLSPSPEWAPKFRKVIVEAATGNALGLPLLRSVLSEVLLANGEAREALSEIDTALSEMKATSQYVFEPSLHLVRARCLVESAQPGEDAEVSFEIAIKAAQRVDARLLEKRATESLAALRQRPFTA